MSGNSRVRVVDPVIRINDLSFRWPGQDNPVLVIGEMVVSRGEKLFIQGPSGCGKTSLLNLISAVTEPAFGAISVLGHDLGQLKGASRDRFRADHIGLIFQQFNLVPYLSMLENVLLPCHFSSIRKHKASRVASIEEEAARILSDLGMESPDLRSRAVTRLSVGQQQRVAAARAVIGQPEIVIADEPTSALDSAAREAFIRLLFNECEQSQTTLVFVSHDMALGKLFDRTILLSEINSAPVSEKAG